MPSPRPFRLADRRARPGSTQAGGPTETQIRSALETRDRLADSSNGELARLYKEAAAQADAGDHDWTPLLDTLARDVAYTKTRDPVGAALRSSMKRRVTRLARRTVPIDSATSELLLAFSSAIFWDTMAPAIDPSGFDNAAMTRLISHIGFERAWTHPSVSAAQRGRFIESLLGEFRSSAETRSFFNTGALLMSALQDPASPPVPAPALAALAGLLTDLHAVESRELAGRYGRMVSADRAAAQITALLPVVGLPTAAVEQMVEALLSTGPLSDAVLHCLLRQGACPPAILIQHLAPQHMPRLSHLVADRDDLTSHPAIRSLLATRRDGVVLSALARTARTEGEFGTTFRQLIAVAPTAAVDLLQAGGLPTWCVLTPELWTPLLTHSSGRIRARAILLAGAVTGPVVPSAGRGGRT